MQQYTRKTKIYDVINDPVFKDYGRLIFPVDRSFSKNMTLQDAGGIYIWYNHINPDKTVEITNYFKDQVNHHQIFYPIYTEKEMNADPHKRDTGLFFFRGKENAKCAICNAGGGFVYVGAMHDSFPHALEISKNGYNAFALIYRPGGNTAMEDLSRAIAFLYENQKELKIDMNGYSLWGGSAGARMAAWMGNYGTRTFISKSYPKPSAIIMQYTGLSKVTGNEPPTYACCGTADWIADDHIMSSRINRIKANGTDAMMEVFPGLPHGFGLGEKTIAEGWINNALAFWKRHMND